MRALHYLTGAILLCAILAGGFYLVYTAWGGDIGELNAVVNNSYYRTAAGAAVMFLGLVFALSAIPSGSARRFIIFDGQGGRISISVDAVTEYLARVAGEFADILDPRAFITSHAAPIKVRLDIRVKAKANIPELCRMLESQVRSSLGNNLGIADVKSVDMNVLEIVATEKPNSREDERSEWQSV